MSIFHETYLDDILLSYLTNHKYNLALTNRYYRNKIFAYLKSHSVSYVNIKEYYHDADIVRYFLYNRSCYLGTIIKLCYDLALMHCKNGIKIAQLYNIIIKQKTYNSSFWKFINNFDLGLNSKSDVYFDIFYDLDRRNIKIDFNFNVLDAFFNCAEVIEFPTIMYKGYKRHYLCFLTWILICRNGRHDLLQYFTIKQVKCEDKMLLFNYYVFGKLLNQYISIVFINNMIQTIKQRNHTEILNYLKDLFKNTDYIIN